MHALPSAPRALVVALCFAAALMVPTLASDPAIDAARLLDHTRRLASDEYEGRAPGSPGEERTVQDVAAQFRASGLKPAGAGGSWFQPVPIVGITCTVDPAWREGGRRQPLTFPQDIVLWSPLTNAEVRIEPSEVVFVGYGVHAPEYGWDDYKGVDVRGKTVVMLVNDPPVPDPKRPGELDPGMFQGRGMTYYGRWTYKFEEAARRGAVAALLVHETVAAAYPWFVVVNSWGRERFELAGDTDAKCPLAGWLSLDAAKELLRAGGLTYEDACSRAVGRDFRPISLPRTFEAVSTQRCRSLDSRNVVGLLEGSDPRRRNEYLVVTAHWDHLGRDPRREGDQIFNGAADNAIGTAGLLELARVMASDSRRRPVRSIVFAALTAEEQGLLGARHYVRKPPLPLAATVANLNIDGMNTWGRTRDVRQVGLGHSTLDATLATVAQRTGRVVLPDPHPERGIFYRSDHFEFLKGRVPALYLKAGDRFLDHPDGYGEARSNEYVSNDYHKVSDDVKPAWDLRGAAEDLELLREVALRVANDRRRPRWKRGSEFAP